MNIARIYVLVVDFPPGDEGVTAKIACRFADALIAELDKSTEGGGA